jgi:hypothetical protein
VRFFAKNSPQIMQLQNSFGTASSVTKHTYAADFSLKLKKKNCPASNGLNIEMA